MSANSHSLTILHRTSKVRLNQLWIPQCLTEVSLAKAINLSSTTGGEAGELKGEVLELANGCLCCSIKDTGLAAIEKLMQKKGAFDYILLETTGLADPGKEI